jgi:magnesium transporter
MTGQSAQAEHFHPPPKVRDFEEEAVEDDDVGAELSPMTHRSRRPTVESAFDQRSISPPNSVKAFAEARRREREWSFSEARPDRKNEEYDLNRTASVSSRGRPQTSGADDAVSLATKKTAEEDVCYPLQDERQDENLYIDFDYLENFMRAESEARLQQRRPSVTRVFPDLRPESEGPASAPPRMVTVDGDILDAPTNGFIHEEKSDDADEAQLKLAPPPPLDPSRVSFFSSAWESTIHAADIEGLILPGEDIRGLFTFPRGERDGVWWLNINKPSEEEVRAVCRAFGIHPLTTEDITAQESREKIELFPSYYFACFRSFYLEFDEETKEQEYVPFNIYVVVFREGTLSFSYAANSHASHVRRRITMLKDYVALSSDWICYALM